MDLLGGQEGCTARAPTVLLLSLALFLHGCGRRSSTPVQDGGAPDASSLTDNTCAKCIGVPQVDLYWGARSIAHPKRPLLAQVVHRSCRVWDLEERLFRGTVPEADCAHWLPEAKPLPPEIEHATPASPSGTEIIAALSPDGRIWAVGRQAGAEVRLFDARELRPLRTLSLCPARKPSCFTRLSGLTWTPEGNLYAAEPSGAPLALDPAGAADPAPLASTVLIESGRFEESGRYMVFDGKSLSAKPGEEGRLTGVLSLRDGAVVMTMPRIGTVNDDSAWTVFWKREGAFFAAAGRRGSAESCEPTGLALRDVDVTAATVDQLAVGDGEVTGGAPSPDGRMLLFATRNLGPCTAAPPTEENRGAFARVHLWAPTVEHGLRWTTGGKLIGAAWSPSSKAVALAVDTTIRIPSLDRASGDPPAIASWSGKPPVVWSPDGARIASREGAVLAVREARSWSRVAEVRVAAAAAAWGPTGTLAVANAARLSLFRTEPIALVESFDLPGVDELAWSPSGSALCARTAGGLFVLEPGKGSPRPLGDRSLAKATCSWVTDVEIIARSALSVHHFTAHDGAWSDAAVPVERGERVDPWGRFEVGPEAILRLADGEVLHYRPDALWTNSYHYSKASPGTWVFRDGPDVLGGRMIREKDATFLSPTPELGARFISGRTLRPMYRGPER